MCQDVLLILPESNDFITCRMIYLFDQTIMTIPDKCPHRAQTLEQPHAEESFRIR